MLNASAVTGPRGQFLLPVPPYMSSCRHWTPLVWGTASQRSLVLTFSQAKSAKSTPVRPDGHGGCLPGDAENHTHGASTGYTQTTSAQLETQPLLPRLVCPCGLGQARPRRHVLHHRCTLCVRTVCTQVHPCATSPLLQSSPPLPTPANRQRSDDVGPEQPVFVHEVASSSEGGSLFLC